jgi:hypothetical protein
MEFQNVSGPVESVSRAEGIQRIVVPPGSLKLVFSTCLLTSEGRGENDFATSKVKRSPETVWFFVGGS